MLFRNGARDFTARHFLADAQWLARRLPECEHLINLCQDRYRFAVLFAACVIAGRVSLLTGEQSSRGIAHLRGRFANCALGGDQLLDAAPPPAAGLAAGPWAPPAIPVSQLAAIVLTSGSTGEPNAFPKRWGELVSRSHAAATRFDLAGEKNAALIGTIPPHHMYGFETTILLPLHAGGASWSGAFFYPADIRDALRSVPGPRILVTTPIHLRAVLEQAQERPPEQIISATAPLDAALAARAETEWGAAVFEIFGATEVGSIASRRTVAEEAWTLYPGVTLAPPEEAPVVSAPFASPHALSDHVELLDDASRFRLLGRSSDLVKLGGRRASLSGLTRILNRIDGVIDGVFLAPDDLDRRPTARLIAIAVAPGHDSQTLLDALRREIDPIFLPRRVVLCDALPRNATGKLPRQALLARIGPDAEGLADG